MATLSIPPPSALNLDRRCLFRHITRYLSATYLSRLLLSVRGFINARWLGPELYGFWGGVVLLTSFGHHLHAGAQDAAAKEIPSQRSRNRADLAYRTTQLAWTFFSGMLLLMAAGIWLFAWTLPAQTPPLIRWGWWVAGGVLLLEVLLAFEEIVTQAEERFTHLSRGLLITSVASLLLACWLVVSYRLAGVYIASLAAPALGLFYLRRHAGYAWRPLWDLAQLRRLLKRGAPILLMTLVFETLWWVDRLLVLGFLGVKALGYYGLGVMLMRFCFLFPQVVAGVFEPRLYYDYAQSRDVAHVREHLWLQLTTLAFVLPLGLAVLDWVLPLVIRHWLPDYLPGLSAIRLLLWGSFSMGLAHCTRSFIVALGLQKRVLKFYGLAVAVNLGVSGWLIFAGWGLVGVAAGTFAAYAVCAAGLIGFSLRQLRWSFKTIAASVVRLYAPMGAMGLFLFLIPDGAAWLHHGFSPGWMFTFKGGGILAYGICVLAFLARSGRMRDLLGAEVAPVAAPGFAVSVESSR